MHKEKKYLLMPDSFKGTMSAETVCEIMEKAIKEKETTAKVKSIPIADGGEGTVDCLIKAIGGEKRRSTVTGPFGKNIESFYGFFGNFAVIEIAAAAGFIKEEEKSNPSLTTTFGVGQLMKKAIEGGCKKIILALGGSCTNDGGAGMLAALGVEFFNVNGEKFVPTGGTLQNIHRIKNEKFQSLVKDINVELMCDINNVLYGPEGAAYVFAKQKGADDHMIAFLDANLKKYAEIIKNEMNIDVSQMKGGGAAGGIGAGAFAFLNAKMRQGIDTFLDIIDFETIAKKYNIIITGEGKLDEQSLSGKVVVGIARRAKKINVPVIAVVGCMEGIAEDFTKEGISEIHTTAATKDFLKEMNQNSDYEKQLLQTMRTLEL